MFWKNSLDVRSSVFGSFSQSFASTQFFEEVQLRANRAHSALAPFGVVPLRPFFVPAAVVY